MSSALQRRRKLQLQKELAEKQTLNDSTNIVESENSETFDIIDEQKESSAQDVPEISPNDNDQVQNNENHVTFSTSNSPLGSNMSSSNVQTLNLDDFIAQANSLFNNPQMFGDNNTNPGVNPFAMFTTVLNQLGSQPFPPSATSTSGVSESETDTDSDSNSMNTNSSTGYPQHHHHHHEIQKPMTLVEKVMKTFKDYIFYIDLLISFLLIYFHSYPYIYQTLFVLVATFFFSLYMYIPEESKRESKLYSISKLMLPLLLPSSAYVTLPVVGFVELSIFMVQRYFKWTLYPRLYCLCRPYLTSLWNYIYSTFYICVSYILDRFPSLTPTSLGIYTLLLFFSCLSIGMIIHYIVFKDHEQPIYKVMQYYLQYCQYNHINSSLIQKQVDDSFDSIYNSIYETSE
ncbi:hypothetical protein WA158_000772 [Blastocystis sp. Blastoise]